MKITQETLRTKEIIDLLLNNNNAFVSYRIPGSKKINFKLFSNKKDSKSQIIKNMSGFLFQPIEVENSYQSYIHNPVVSFNNLNIPEDLNDISISESFDQNLLPVLSAKFNSDNKDSYVKIIRRAIREIKAGSAEKIVISRQIYNPNLDSKKGGKYFTALCKKYPNAFVYFFYIPGEMAWMGASPEIFLKGNKKEYSTMALAGTVHNKGQDITEWGEKEITEQKIVGDYIETTLNNLGITEFIKDGPETVSAGNVFHLQTKYTFNFQKKENDISAFTEALHPTPAVCGLPVKEALNLIKSLETNKRDYYCGIAGSINNKGDVNFYVNLRCMQFFEKGAVIYSGGGITIESNPEKEWDETCFKADTLLSVLEKL